MFTHVFRHDWKVWWSGVSIYIRDHESPEKKHTLKQDKWSEENRFKDDGLRKESKVTLGATWYVIFKLRWSQCGKQLIQEACVPVSLRASGCTGDSGSGAGSFCRNRKWLSPQEPWCLESKHCWLLHRFGED